MAEHRIAVIPVFQDKIDAPKRLVLVTARRSGEWILPTGRTERSYSDRRIAVLEAHEEAGARGQLDRKFKQRLQVQAYRGKDTSHLTLYLLKVEELLEHWPEHGQRQRQLVGAEDLHRYFRDKKLLKLLRAMLAD